MCAFCSWLVYGYRHMHLCVTDTTSSGSGDFSSIVCDCRSFVHLPSHSQVAMSSFDSMEPVLRTTPLGLRPHPARFNLLLLESGDIYFEDAQVEYIVQLDAGLPGTPPR